MTKYLFTINESTTYEVIIEADTLDKAQKKLHKQGYNHTNISEANLECINYEELKPIVEEGN